MIRFGAILQTRSCARLMRQPTFVVFSLGFLIYASAPELPAQTNTFIPGTTTPTSGTRGSVDFPGTGTFAPPTNTVAPFAGTTPLAGGTVSNLRGDSITYVTGAPAGTSQPFFGTTGASGIQYNTSVAAQDTNVFTGRPMPGTAISSQYGDLPLVGEDYERLDTNAVVASGTVGRGLTRTGQGRRGTTEYAGDPAGGFPQQFLTTTPSGVTTIPGRTVGRTITRVDVASIPRPGVRPSSLRSTPARDTTRTATATTTRPATTTTPSRITSPIAPTTGTRTILSAPAPTATTRQESEGEALPSLASERATPVIRPDEQPIDTGRFVFGGDSLVQDVTPGEGEQAQPTTTAEGTPTQVASTTPAAPGSLPSGTLTRILYDPAETNLPESAKQTLARIADQIKSNPNVKVQLVAYASEDESVPTSAGKRAVHRAIFVRSHLVSLGVNASQMQVKARFEGSDGGPEDRLDVVLVSQ